MKYKLEFDTIESAQGYIARKIKAEYNRTLKYQKWVYSLDYKNNKYVLEYAV